MKAAKVMVFGSTGLLGCSLIPNLIQRNYKVVTIGRSLKASHVVDLLDNDALTRVINLERPDCIVNLVAATNVDHCELNVPDAMLANALIPQAVSNAILHSNIPKTHFIHLSTDQVYDGTGQHNEDRVSPVNVYGLTKLAGELLITAPHTTILRTNFFGKSHSSSKSSFSDWIYNALLGAEQVTLFSDVFFNALHMSTLCDFIALVIDKNVTGTFNLGSSNGISKAEFALTLAKELKHPFNNAIIGSLADRSRRARRPMNMTMNVEKFESELNVKCPIIFEEIAKTAKEYENATASPRS